MKTMFVPAERLYTRTEAAQMLGLNYSTMMSRIKYRRLKVGKKGVKRSLTMADVEKLAKAFGRVPVAEVKTAEG